MYILIFAFGSVDTAQPDTVIFFWLGTYTFWLLLGASIHIVPLKFSLCTTNVFEILDITFPLESTWSILTICLPSGSAPTYIVSSYPAFFVAPPYWFDIEFISGLLVLFIFCNQHAPFIYNFIFTFGSSDTAQPDTLKYSVVGVVIVLPSCNVSDNKIPL